MEMSEFEICQSYTLARDKFTQIVILSELNLCDVGCIREILERHGCLIDQPQQHKHHRTLIDKDKALRMIGDGKTDREIANYFGCSKYAVYSFRRRHGLIGKVAQDK